ncbi:flavin reductase family protein [Ornithinimicrobium cryptoxanthini]|uniref:flavin reductase family protein n=1 Tax=Ornithinimicrobium cryptoxanthini TaxID=2934161 RepID=UPI0027426E99|nr:flavin reductase family protein [Ornithinimicrobium cryptoxanthini]
MRDALGRFATGVAVITTHDGAGRPQGMTVNSLTSVSLTPPLILVCLSESARTTKAALATGSFVASVLSERQEPLARRFASPANDHFADLDLHYGEHLLPVIPEALAHIECSVADVFPGGDHVILVGHVARLCARPGQPLAFYSGKFGDYQDRGQEPVRWFF